MAQPFACPAFLGVLLFVTLFVSIVLLERKEKKNRNERKEKEQKELLPSV